MPQKKRKPLLRLHHLIMAGTSLFWLSSCWLFVKQPEPEYQCYWMENVSGNYAWILPSSELYGSPPDFKTCYALDSCNGGQGLSGGGCYKWADSPTGERVPWEKSK